MRPSSSISEQPPDAGIGGESATGLFGPLTGDGLVSDRAWLAAMLEVEAALAGAEARAGLIPAAAADAIAEACDPDRFDLDDIGRRAVGAGNPVVPLVSDLTARVAPAGAAHVHLGATSQDILDTAMSLIAHRVLGQILDELGAAAASCARLADGHRGTVMAGRTLLQQALPTTFGVRCAGWLVAVDEAAAGLAQVQRRRLAAQLGGAAGTLAGLGTAGPAVVHGFAADLGLAEPVVPWHTNRVRVAELAAALGIAAGVLGKIALDVILLAQTEVAEVSEAGEAGHGGSSTLPHKRNPVGAVLVSSATRRVPGLVATILAGMAQEHERAAGAWHAEWQTITQLLGLVLGAATRTRALLDGLRVDAERMAGNLAISAGLVMAESVAGRLTPFLDRGRAGELLADLCRQAAEARVPLIDVLRTDATVSGHMSEAEIAAALDPSGYLGCGSELIDRALAAHSGGAP